MSRRLALTAAAFVAGFLACAPGKAAADEFIRLSDRESRFCEDTGILGRITDKFRWQVKHVPNLPDVGIVDFRKIHEHRYEPYSEDHPIARRYCGATAVLSDGARHDIWYLIEDGMGIIGIGDNVEFCVSGFDRWKVYNGQCRVLW